MAHWERLNRELEIAREVQEHLFPQSVPSVPGLDYCGRCRPAREVALSCVSSVEILAKLFPSPSLLPWYF